MDSRTLRLRRELLTTLDVDDLVRLRAAAAEDVLPTQTCSDNLPPAACQITTVITPTT